ncbi:hypothetical protein AVEN_194308-1 [Araneus ventricosus]|uniref:Uncharacterized protein n=1 Tax=Araneus ventricosus TaxID=182803 RepID=A0A4Y2S4E6_ARAVE|nr:hypothetical protein AVEN_194308-1 [Araneus ventricosus]
MHLKVFHFLEWIWMEASDLLGQMMSNKTEKVNIGHFYTMFKNYVTKGNMWLAGRLLKTCRKLFSAQTAKSFKMVAKILL